MLHRDCFDCFGCPSFAETLCPQSCHCRPAWGVLGGNGVFAAGLHNQVFVRPYSAEFAKRSCFLLGVRGANTLADSVLGEYMHIRTSPCRTRLFELTEDIDLGVAKDAIALIHKLERFSTHFLSTDLLCLWHPFCTCQLTELALC